MLKGLERRYTFEEIEAQDVALIKPRLNYNALNTLRNPMYVKFAQQVGDASKDQHEARAQHIQNSTTINNIAHKTGLNEAELQQLFNGFFAEKLSEQSDDEMPPARRSTPEPPERGGNGGPSGGGSGSGGGDGPSGGDGNDLAERAAAYQRRVDPERTQGGTLDHWARGPNDAVTPNDDTFRINLQLQAEIQVLKQEYAMRARQEAARQKMITPHREELRSIVQHFHTHTQQAAPAPPQDNSHLVGALQTIAQQNHALGSVLEEKNLGARQMVELAHASMQAQAHMMAQR